MGREIVPEGGATVVWDGEGAGTVGCAGGGTVCVGGGAVWEGEGTLDGEGVATEVRDEEGSVTGAIVVVSVAGHCNSDNSRIR